MNEKKIAHKIAQLMLDKKAVDIKIINVTGLTSLTDYFINCSSESDPQTRAIKNHIQDKLFEEYNIKPLNIEGYEGLKWILMDYINIVINVFHKEQREYYNVERLWADGEIEDIK
tara:strand:- start:13189 stop:13533 length:345 start_codon:yes stop_codon:yes gene_type:complete